MPVIDIRPDWTLEEMGVETARLGWTVRMSSVTDTAVMAATANGIPRKGEPHPADTWKRVSQVSARRKGTSPLLWQVTVDYAKASLGTSQTNPLYEPAEISWDWAASNEPIDRDADGNAIVNSANQPFDPPLTEEFLDPVLTITRNEASDDPSQRILYANAVNTDAFYGAAPGQARMNGIRAQRMVTGLTVYWRKTYVIQFRGTPPGESDPAKAWRRRVLDQGCYERVPTTAGFDMKAIPDKDGRAVTTPMPLDGNGRLLDKGKKAVWLYFKTRKALPFSVFRLPNP